jgi:hypothetical protein
MVGFLVNLLLLSFMQGEYLTMQSQIYGLLMVLGLVLFQVGCCELVTSSTVEGHVPVTLYNNDDRIYYSTPEQTISLGNAFRLETSLDFYLERVVSVTFTSLTSENLADENPTSYSGITFSVPIPEGITIYVDGDSPLGSREIRIEGKVSLLQDYMTSLQHTLRPDIQRGSADIVQATLMYAGYSGNTAYIQVNYTDPPVPTPNTPITTSVGETSSIPSVNPSNIAPINTVPGTQGVTYRQPHIMNFMVADSDIANNTLTVTLQVGKGILTVIPATGATVSGNDSGSVTISGSIDAVNNTLLGADGVGLSQGVIYHYTGDDLPEGSATTDTLSFTSQDNYNAVANDFVRLEISNPAPLATSVPPTIIVPTVVPPTSVPPTAIQPTTIPATSIPPTSIPPTSIPPTSIPPTSIPPTSIPPTSIPPTAIPCTGLNTTPIFDTMFGNQDLNFDLSSGVTDASAVEPFTFSTGGLPTGFAVNGYFLQANESDVWGYGSDLNVTVNVTDANGCQGSYALTLQLD